MPADRFSDLLGSARGPMLGTDLTASEPSPRGQRQALALCRQAQEGELDGALAALSCHGPLVVERPLLQAVLSATALSLAQAVARDRVKVMRAVLDAVGLHARPSELCVALGDVVHVWPQGQGVSEMGAGDRTLCGLRGAGQVVRPARGLVAHSHRACAACLRAADGQFAELAGEGYLYPVGRRRVAELTRILPATVGAALQCTLTARALTSMNARALALQAHDSLWAAELSERAVAAGERAVRAVLGVERYRTLRGSSTYSNDRLDVDAWRPHVETALRTSSSASLGDGIARAAFVSVSDGRRVPASES